MIAKRLLDIALVLPGLLVVLPVMLLAALWIKMDSPGPVLFRQKRVGRFGHPFQVLKFRTMVTDAEKRGGRITLGEDPRITRSGRFLRRFKLDELPQLFNVLSGEMSLVGPRPEVPEYVARYPERAKAKVLSVPPGITDFAAIEYRNENALLAGATDWEQTYLDRILPTKIDYYLYYVNHRNLLLDVRLILTTLAALVRKDSKELSGGR